MPRTCFAYDGLGSTADLTDDEGDEVDDYTYDVFGAIRSQSGSSDNYWLFTGQQADSGEGLYYLRARSALSVTVDRGRRGRRRG